MPGRTTCDGAGLPPPEVHQEARGRLKRARERDAADPRIAEIVERLRRARQMELFVEETVLRAGTEMLEGMG